MATPSRRSSSGDETARGRAENHQNGQSGLETLLESAPEGLAGHAEAGEFADGVPDSGEDHVHRSARSRANCPSPQCAIGDGDVDFESHTILLSSMEWSNYTIM